MLNTFSGMVAPSSKRITCNARKGSGRVETRRHLPPIPTSQSPVFIEKKNSFHQRKNKLMRVMPKPQNRHHEVATARHEQNASNVCIAKVEAHADCQYNSRSTTKQRPIVAQHKTIYTARALSLSPRPPSGEKRNTQQGGAD